MGVGEVHINGMKHMQQGAIDSFYPQFIPLTQHCYISQKISSLKITPINIP